MNAPSPDLACLIEQGDRRSQQDAVRVSANDDGSWVIAVADGTGGGINPEQAAPAAVAALPGRIASDDEMTAAFVAANRAVRFCGPPESRARMGEDRYAGCSVDPDTTLAVAAWTPEGGLVAAWIGDSIVLVVPLDGRAVWYSPPQKMAAGNPLIGEFAACGGEAPKSLRRTISRLSGSRTHSDVDQMTADGAIVAVLSDGAYKGYMSVLTEGLSFDDGFDNSLKSLLPRQSRACASAAADSIMGRARAVDLHDNASIAVARLAPR